MATTIAGPATPVPHPPVTATVPSSPTSPPPPSSPRLRKWPRGVLDAVSFFVKLRNTTHHRISSSSGDAQTHPSLATQGATCPIKVPIVRTESFVCQGAVDTVKLLRAVRSRVFKHAAAMGANVLIDERWQSTITENYRGSPGMYHAQITYWASASRSAAVQDPAKPIAIDQAQSIPGLMTILSRD